MKSRTKKSRYLRLQTRIFLQLSLMALGTIILIWAMYVGVFSGRLADWAVGLIQRLFFVDYEQALGLYNYYVRGNFDLIFWLVFAFLFLFLFRFALSWFMKYFRQIDRGLDALLLEDDKEIVLSPEISEMEQKLNLVRHTLQKRKLETLLSEQRKNDMVMYLAHDIRTPLTTVIGYLSLLEEAPDMPETQREKYVHITLDKAYRLEHLVNEFFEITRYNLQQIILEKEEIDLSYLLIQMADEFYPILEDHANKIELDVPENLRIFGDPDRLARVFNNILKNAVAYSRPGTLIRIRARQSHGEVFVCFENQGRTIPRQKLDAIFEKFYRLDEARQTESGGAGLGLAIAREIVLLHGGRITAQSEDGVTVFRVELPVKSAGGSS